MIFKHDHLAPVHSSRAASRRLHRRPAFAAGAAAAQAPADCLTQHARRRQAVVEPKATLLALLAAETRIADLEQALDEARAAALTDTLTGALNRRGFDQAYQREVARARRNDSHLALALIDLDDFKCLNDTFGHQVGDQALVHLVTVLR
ncbi:MAG: diguanylate cyclase, partial [Candidatus Accumulibacter sp.]|uniref:GGDEF domain-containing protein n=1 Tax=Accumulibacter sp. TaxID=2053492 RepID=UPI001A508773